jgi:prepilin-type N-terminal cleavage/methylation domain-containing protein
MNRTINNAYTILELIIVMAIISGLATLFLATYPASQRRSRDTRRRSDIKQYQTVLEVYASSNQDLYLVVGPPAANLSTQCASLDLTAAQCQDDSTYPYQIISSSTSYVIWALMEQPNNAGATVYFVACSNGVNRELTTVPSSAVCPP